MMKLIVKMLQVLSLKFAAKNCQECNKDELRLCHRIFTYSEHTFEIFESIFGKNPVLLRILLSIKTERNKVVYKKKTE